ncbi:hypothetical protein CEXT_473411 [Caerostris extrusa]|uniref:Uncharacterized protein n=1 Tax=Caerostris extrusa TaxID=172846 RepID=A0AAV4XC42_CAEEX|nr:hypothetical protein CEXT_473411 [Caerostris extrusa]
MIPITQSPCSWLKTGEGKNSSMEACFTSTTEIFDSKQDRHLPCLGRGKSDKIAARLSSFLGIKKDRKRTLQKICYTSVW